MMHRGLPIIFFDKTFPQILGSSTFSLLSIMGARCLYSLWCSLYNAAYIMHVKRYIHTYVV